MGNKNNKEPQPVQTEVLYSEEYDDESIVIAAEQVAVGAFRRWVKDGLDAGRAQTVLNSPEGSLKGKLQGSREFSVVRRAADAAIKRSYGSIENLDNLDTILN